MQILFGVMMFVMGACIGSFLCCQARRMHYRETSKKKLGNRSVCMHCKKKLKWWENIPIVSWLILRGKCSKCGKKIGLGEFLSEIGIAVMMAGISTTIDVARADVLSWVIFVLIVVLAALLGFLAIYDGLYGELPSAMLIAAGGVAVVFAVVKMAAIFSVSGLSFAPILELIGSVAILGGLYLVLYLVSRGKWVGDGDYLLAGIIGLALGSSWLSLVVLFVANLVACLVMYPVVRGKKSKKIYFGPFLVIAFVIVVTFSKQIYGIIGL